MSEESSQGTSSGRQDRVERGSDSGESLPKIIIPKLKNLQVSSVSRYLLNKTRGNALKHFSLSLA